MTRYHNIEKSGFHREYVAWDAQRNRYRVRKNGPRRERGSWWVYPAELGKGLPVFYAGTLALVSLRLERMQATCAMPRLPHER